MAGIENLNQAIVTQYLNNSDVRTALEKKGLKLTEKSVFKMEGNKVQIDIEGDGVYDKMINGLFRKDGSINTNHKKLDVDDTAVNTSYIKQQNGAIKQMEDFISALDSGLEDVKSLRQQTEELKFDEAARRAEIKQQKAAIEAKLNKAKDELQNMKQDYEKNHNDWTSKQCKEYNKKLAGAQKNIAQLQNEFDNFDVDVQVVQARQNFEEAKSARLAYYDGREQEIQNQKTKQEQKLHKALHAYNDYLNKNGYETTEARSAVKDLEYDGTVASEAGVRFAKAETTEATVVRMATEAFKKANPDVSDFSVKYDTNTGAVSISLKDGDTIADYTISGFYDPGKKTLNFDANKLNLSENATSTRRLAAADSNLKGLERAADAIDYAMNPEKAKAGYDKIDRFKAQMAGNGITMDAIEEYRKQHEI